MDKLDTMLTERGIEHTYGRRFPEMDELVSKEPDLFKDQDWGTQLWSTMAKCEHGMLSADMVRMAMNKD